MMKERYKGLVVYREFGTKTSFFPNVAIMPSLKLSTPMWHFFSNQ